MLVVECTSVSVIVRVAQVEGMLHRSDDTDGRQYGTHLVIFTVVKESQVRSLSLIP